MEPSKNPVSPNLSPIAEFAKTAEDTLLAPQEKSAHPRPYLLALLTLPLILPEPRAGYLSSCSFYRPSYLFGSLLGSSGGIQFPQQANFFLRPWFPSLNPQHTCSVCHREDSPSKLLGYIRLCILLVRIQLPEQGIVFLRPNRRTKGFGLSDAYRLCP